MNEADLLMLIHVWAPQKIQILAAIVTAELGLWRAAKPPATINRGTRLLVKMMFDVLKMCLE